MSFLFFGKLFIAIGLCFQAYVLFDNPEVANAFNSKLASALSSCDCIPADIQAQIKEHLRLVVVGLLGCSALMVIIRSSFFKLLVILGLGILIWVNNHPLRQIPTFKDYRFWESLAILGGVIYLMGAEAHAPAPAKAKAKKE